MAFEDSKLVQVFDTLVKKAKKKETTGRVDIFEGWSDQRKILYMKGLQVKLPEATTAPDLKPIPGFKHVTVPDSVLCDISYDNTAQGNYESSIGHYLSWQYSESDLRLEFGSERRRSFVTRPFGTFVFYFRYDRHVVGLVIDGQCGYAEGCITQIYRDDDSVEEHILQFKRKMNKPDYIKSRRTHNLHFSGNYTEGRFIYEVDLSREILRKTIVKIATFRPMIDEEPRAIWFQRLILYAAEAPRIRTVFQATSRSLGSEINENIGVLRILECEEAIVLNYKQLSIHALEAIRSKKFKSVTGTTPRNLFQVLSSIVLLRREMVFPTKIILPDAPREESEPPLQGERGQQLSKKRRLELLNKRGTQFCSLHRGERAFESEAWILDLWGDSFQVGGPAPEVFDLTEDRIEKFATGVPMVSSLPHVISYPTLANAPHMFINGYKNVLAIAVETDYSYPHAYKIKEYLKASAPTGVGLASSVNVVITPVNTGQDPSQTSFLQVEKKHKKTYDWKLCNLLDEYTKVLIALADNIYFKQLKDIRRGLRGDSVVFMGKNTLIRRCIKAYAEKSGNHTFDPLMDILFGNVGLIFTKEDLMEVRKDVAKYKVGYKNVLSVAVETTTSTCTLTGSRSTSRT